MNCKNLFCICACLFSANYISAQVLLQNKDNRVQKASLSKSAVSSTAVTAVPTFKASSRTAPLPDADSTPTIASVTPNLQTQGGKVVITGTNFDEKTTVTFGGVAAKSITIGDSQTLVAVIAGGATGDIVITNSAGSKTLTNGFTFIPPAPTITTVSPAAFVHGGTVTILGTNFQKPLSVVFDGKSATNIQVISPTSMSAIVNGDISSSTVTVITQGGTVTYPAANSSPLDGNADITLPDFGKGITIIPTPTFTYSAVQSNNFYSFSCSIWANSLGTDSTRQNVGSKFLLSQTSLFGFKIANNFRLTNSNSSVYFSLYGDASLLVKKVGFYDTVAKLNTSFNPLAIQLKLGASTQFFNILSIGAYFDVLSIETENANVSQFFQTGGKNVFVYPEVNIAGVFPTTKGGNQFIKAEIDMVINNKNSNYFYGLSNSVIPYLKIGFVTGL